MASFQRFYILWLGLLFLAVSGCRSRGVDKSADKFGSFSSDRIGMAGSNEKFNHTDDINGKENSENLMHDRRKSDKIIFVSNDSVKKENTDYVQQPANDPMKTVTAYGTMMYERQTTIIQKPEEK